MNSAIDHFGISRGMNAPIVRFVTRHMKRAGRICRHYFARGCDVKFKSDGSAITEADKAVERYLTQAIRSAFPEHDIVGEEYAPHTGVQQTDSAEGADTPHASTDFTWYIDPIDGTFSFIHGIPLYSCLLALYHKTEPLLGVIYNPELREFVIAIRNAGCYFNGTPTKVAPCTKLSDARMLCTELSPLLREAPGTRTLLESCRSMRTWCDAYGYTLLVTGRGDLVFDAGLKPWDIAPLYIVVQEAGGIISDFSGASRPLGENTMAASTGGIYEQALRILQE